MKASKFLLRGPVGTMKSPLDARHHLCNDHKIYDQRRSQQRVFADVEDANGLVASHENLRIVLIERTFVVAYCRHVLDNHGVIWMLTLLVQNGVCRDHVVNHIRLGDLFRPKLLLRAQIHAVIVAKMVVARDGGDLDTGIDEEVYKSRLHLGLPRLEVISADERTMLFGKLDRTGDERVLRGSIDKRSALQDACDGKYS